jgi:hypothetical protein
MDYQKQTLNLQNWHDFLLVIQKSGFRSSKMISSKITLMYSYVLYLIGKIDLKIDRKKLDRAIGRWFFTATLTSRYTGGSPESMMERDLANLRSVKDGDTFLKYIDGTIDSELTQDFWEVTLPSRMVTSSVNSPMLNTFYASQNLLEAKALFSEIRIWDALDPTTNANKNKVERHHLIPKNYLKSFGITSVRDTNQIANFTLVEWHDNISISDTPPSEYLAKYRELIGNEVMDKMYYWHALPVDWESMNYNDFLIERRKLISKVIKDGFNRLTKGAVSLDRPVTLEDMVAQGEGIHTEFKSTLRVNLHTNEKDPKMEHAVLKTLCGFLNSDGGTLIVGVADNGNLVDLKIDGFPNEDKMELHLGNLIKSRMGPETMLHLKPHFKDYKGGRAFLVSCKSSKIPVYLKTGNDEEFFIRAGGSSAKLTPSQMTEYIKQRF